MAAVDVKETNLADLGFDLIRPHHGRQSLVNGDAVRGNAEALQVVEKLLLVAGPRSVDVQILPAENIDGVTALAAVAHRHRYEGFAVMDADLGHRADDV